MRLVGELAHLFGQKVEGELLRRRNGGGRSFGGGFLGKCEAGLAKHGDGQQCARNGEDVPAGEPGVEGACDLHRGL